MKNATQEQIAEAFTEWERRFREDPEKFQTEAEKLLKETPKTYGEACAPYFLSILSEIQNRPTHSEGCASETKTTPPPKP